MPEDSQQPDSLPELFWTVARQLRRASIEMLAPWDIAPSHARALSVLIGHGAMRPSALSEHLHITPRSVTEMVDSLEERGLVTRADDPDDRRATIVALTPQGEQLGQSIRTARAHEGERIFGSLSTTDQAELRRILTTLVP
jgi:DNA-binding MarR family transcriptional regulator